MLATAAHYEGLDRLKWMCEYTLKKRLDLNNCYAMMIELEKFAPFVKYMREYCLRFAGKNHFVTDKN